MQVLITPKRKSYEKEKLCNYLVSNVLEKTLQKVETNEI